MKNMKAAEKSIFEELCEKWRAALLPEFAAYPVHTIWTVQQECSEKLTLPFLKAYKNIAAEGYGKFYKGFPLVFFATLPILFLYLCGAKLATKCFDEPDVAELMRGPFAQGLSSVIAVPVNKLVELEQATTGNVSGNAFKRLAIRDKCSHIYATSGVPGFYRGAFPLLLIMSASDGIGFWLRKRILSRCFSEEQSKQLLPQLFSTSVGFGVAYFFLTPFFAVETRLRLHESNPAIFKDTAFFPTMRTLFRQRGWRGLRVAAPASGLYGAISSLPVAFCGDCIG